MTSRFTLRCRISAFLSLAALACAWPPSARAQEAGPNPIRVETRDVYIPVLVLDKTRIDELQKMDVVQYGKKLVANSLDFGAVAVRDLPAKDFRLFVDGRQQTIQSVTPDFQLARPFTDSEGVSEDFVGAGGGIWIAPGIATDTDADTLLNVPDWPGYLIAYVPPAALEKDCHHIAVKVDRPHSLVFGRTAYCFNVDPLKGTDVGNQLQSDLKLEKTGKIGLSLTAADFFTDTQASRVQISVDFSPNVMLRAGDDCYGLPEIRLLGMIYNKDGTLAARFSDFMSRNFGPRGQAMPLLLPNSNGGISCHVDAPSYETQIQLAPGEYDLRVALREGKDSGRASISFAVQSHAENRLAVSGIALVKRFRQVPSGPPQLSTELPVNYEPLLSKGLEFTPTADTTFSRIGPIHYYLEIFEPPPMRSPAPEVQLHLRIVDAQSGEVKNDFPPFSAGPYAKAGYPGTPIGGEVDISGLPPGLYRLEAQAIDSTGSATPWRAANFALQ